MFLANSDITLEQRLSQYPSLKNRIELLINIIEDSAGDCQKANEAEMRVIEATPNGQRSPPLLVGTQDGANYRGFRQGT